MSVTLLRGDALALPLADDSVDLIVTSPPYFGLRSYTDGGEHYAGQIGSEATPTEFLDALIAATAEMRRVLKPSGSIFVNLGDKYSGSSNSQDNLAAWSAENARGVGGAPQKSLMLIPERYRIRCVDELGLIARAVLVWSKPNGLPESVTDRVRRSHEDWVHLTKQPRYYAAVDEIREPATGDRRSRSAPEFLTSNSHRGVSHRSLRRDPDLFNPLGKLPGSVWTVPTQPLTVPPELGVDHFAAFPMEWPRRLIRGWSPPGICVECGEGRRPVTQYTGERGREPGGGRTYATMRPAGARDTNLAAAALRPRDITGYVCACTPYTDHPGTGERYFRGNPGGGTRGANVTGKPVIPHVARGDEGPVERTGPWREYHFADWTPPPTRPAVVLDPFSGTGTVALVADALGRHGVGVDMSADYCRLARWRTTDPGQRAAALQVPKPPPVAADQDDLLSGLL